MARRAHTVFVQLNGAVPRLPRVGPDGPGLRRIARLPSSADSLLEGTGLNHRSRRGRPAFLVFGSRGAPVFRLAGNQAEAT